MTWAAAGISRTGKPRRCPAQVHPVRPSVQEPHRLPVPASGVPRVGACRDPSGPYGSRTRSARRGTGPCHGPCGYIPDMKQLWWLIAGAVVGFIYSDFWRSWWNLIPFLGVVAAYLTVMIVRARCGERSTRNPRELPRAFVSGEARRACPVRSPCALLPRVQAWGEVVTRASWSACPERRSRRSADDFRRPRGT